MQNGITLIALVITIIIMLILAGISISAIVGENGIVSRATNAKLVAEDASRREALDMILFDYNASEFLGEVNGIEKYLQTAKNNGQIQAFSASSDGEYAIIRYEGHNYEATREAGKGNYAISGELDPELEVDNNIILTSNTINNIIDKNGGSFAFENGDSYIVKDDIKAEEFNFNITDNSLVTIKLMTDMTIDNVGYQRSAINLGENSTLNLYVYGNVTVNSGLGQKGDETDYMSSNAGGYAGIHVPESATLNLYGTGKITAIGGDAGDGNAYTVSESGTGGTGGGGAGAGIGGNGGYGSGYAVGKGANGGNGENCGKVNIYNSVKLYAYGGAGGSGAKGTRENGSGAGGYPAAGIGGGGAGGAGGTCCAGGGGYSGGGRR